MYTRNIINLSITTGYRDAGPDSEARPKIPIPPGEKCTCIKT